MAGSKWRKSPQSLIDTFEAVMPGPPEVKRRKMFGYPSCFVNGNLMGGLHQSDMILRLSEGTVRPCFPRADGPSSRWRGAGCGST